MLKPKEERILGQFLQDMSETITEICLRDSKLLGAENDFTEEERILAYNTACLMFIWDVAVKQGREAEWLDFLYMSISNRYDDGLRDVRACRAWNGND